MRRLRPIKKNAEVYEAERWIDNDNDDNEIQVYVNVEVSGEYHPATMWDPAELPEAEVLDVVVRLWEGKDYFDVVLPEEHPLRARVIELHGEDCEIEAIEMFTEED